MTKPTDAARKQLSATGQLRAGMNLGNALFTGKDANGALYGVSVDLMTELAKQLGVPLQQVVYATPGEVADSAEHNAWDVAILAIEPARAQTVDFSPAMTEIEATYVVRKDSNLQTPEQVDAAGVRITAPQKAGYELYLTRTLKNATLLREKNLAACMELFNNGGADALASLRPTLLESQTKLPNGRLLQGRFTTINHGLGTPRGRSAAAQYLKEFVQDMVRTGFIAESIARHKVQGLAAIK